jgi:hypothetical protein
VHRILLPGSLNLRVRGRAESRGREDDDVEEEDADDDPTSSRLAASGITIDDAPPEVLVIWDARLSSKR